MGFLSLSIFTAGSLIIWTGVYIENLFFLDFTSGFPSKKSIFPSFFYSPIQTLNHSGINRVEIRDKKGPIFCQNFGHRNWL